jgi:acyl-CoA thioesterase
MRESRSSRQIAEACGVRIYQGDRAARSLGVVLDEIGPGRSRVSLTVREEMLNAYDICHGGVIFSLADCAFAYACNSRNRKTVAAGATVDYLSAARLGDRLTAVAEERALAGRTGVYDVRVVDQSGELIACFRGRSRRVAGTLLPESDASVDREESAASDPTA